MRSSAASARILVVLVASVVQLALLAIGIVTRADPASSPLVIVALVTFAAAILVLVYLSRHGMTVSAWPGRVRILRVGADPTDMNRVDPATGKTLARLEAERRFDVQTAPPSRSSQEYLNRALAERGLHWDVPAADLPIVCSGCENVNPPGVSRCGRCGRMIQSA